jgi:hypothetical protein
MIKKSFENSILDSYWAEALKNKLDKVAVQSKRVDDILFNRINDVVKSKSSKFSSVEDKVKEMLERSGVNSYSKNIKMSKKAEVNENNSGPKLFQKYPQILNTLENIIKDSKGTLPVIAILDKLHSLHKRDVEDQSLFQDDSLKQFIVRKNLEIKAQPEQSSTLGKNHFKEDLEENIFLDSIKN